MKKRILHFFILILLISLFRTGSLFSQNTSPNKFVEWTTWTLIQTIPSPTFYQDRNENDSRLQFGLRWHITPLNFSFNANRLVTPVQFFKVNPVRRYGGSLELFLQPEWATASFKYADLKRFNLSAGLRGFIPAVEYGEYLAFSLGGQYNIRKNNQNNDVNFYSAEAGIYTLFGILGLVVDYNFISESRYSISINLKYY